VLDGLNIVRGRGDLRGLFLLAAIPSFCIFPYISFMPVFAKDVLEIGPQGLGLLMASSGAGAVIGGLMVAGGRQERNMGRMLVAGAICYSLVISIFGLSSAVWLSIPALIVAGLIGSYFMSSNNALIQHRITDDVRGRVMGTYMLTWGLMPLGALPLGILADAIGIQVTTVAGAMITIALTIAATLRNRSILEL
jgi:predicted MFS family arabinose efflux permease